MGNLTFEHGMLSGHIQVAAGPLTCATSVLDFPEFAVGRKKQGELAVPV